MGIYSQNCPEWVLVEQGLYSYSMVIIALYDTLGADACAFIINQGNFNGLAEAKVFNYMLTWMA